MTPFEQAFPHTDLLVQELFITQPNTITLISANLVQSAWRLAYPHSHVSTRTGSLIVRAHPPGACVHLHLA